jgi:hypothetical protein
MDVPAIPFNSPFAAPFTMPLDLHWFANPETVAIWLLLMAWVVGGVLAATLFALLSGAPGRYFAWTVWLTPATPARICAWWRGGRRMSP